MFAPDRTVTIDEFDENADVTTVVCGIVTYQDNDSDVEAVLVIYEVVNK